MANRGEIRRGRNRITVRKHRHDILAMHDGLGPKLVPRKKLFYNDLLGMRCLVSPTPSRLHCIRLFDFGNASTAGRIRSLHHNGIAGTICERPGGSIISECTELGRGDIELHECTLHEDFVHAPASRLITRPRQSKRIHNSPYRRHAHVGSSRYNPADSNAANGIQDAIGISRVQINKCISQLNAWVGPFRADHNHFQTHIPSFLYQWHLIYTGTHDQYFRFHATLPCSAKEHQQAPLQIPSVAERVVNLTCISENRVIICDRGLGHG